MPRRRQKLFHASFRDQQRGRVDQRMTAQQSRIPNRLFKDDLDLIFHIVDQRQRADRTGRDAQVFEQPLGRGQTQLSNL